MALTFQELHLRKSHQSLGLKLPANRLYRGKGTKARKKKEFEKRYGGKKKGDYVYGATVGKVKRERAKKRKR